MTSISIRSLSKRFPTKDNGWKTVIDSFSLNIPARSFFTILGPNGSGKSTLLNLVSGVLQPDAGVVEVNGLEHRRPRIGYVWQDYRASLLPWADVTENVSFALRIQGMSRSKRLTLVQEALGEFRLGILPTQRCYELSGGQQQLVSILRSTVGSPDLLLLDEPLSALDQATSWTMAFKLERVWSTLAVPALLVSHDVDEAIMLADEVLLMSRQGRIAQRIMNTLPRPREVKMLTSSEHARCRQEVIEFLFEQGALRDDRSAV